MSRSLVQSGRRARPISLVRRLRWARIMSSARYTLIALSLAIAVAPSQAEAQDANEGVALGMVMIPVFVALGSAAIATAGCVVTGIGTGAQLPTEDGPS